MVYRLTIAVGLALLAAGSTAGAAGRNVVLLIGDDQGLQVGCYGHPVIKTPSLDRLASQGTRFTNAFAAVSSCSPSRSVMMTGMYTHSTGQYGLAHGPHHFYSFEKIQSLPKLLRGAGYRTGIVGKYHVKPPAVYPFDEHLPCPGGARNVTGMAASAKTFMAAESDKPFFLLVGYVDPHRAGKGFGNDKDYPGVDKIEYKPEEVVVPPWLPDAPEVRAELADYYESISRLDQGIGQVLDAVAATGHADDTLVMYVSDNGPPWPGAKTTLYEPGIHLPLIVSAPTQKRRSVANQAMVSFVDITPTILDWAGVKAPKAVAGRSLLPILEQENPPGWDTIYASHTFHAVTSYYPMRAIRTRRYKYILNLADPLEYPVAADLWGSDTWQGVLHRGDTYCGRRTVEAFLHRPKEELYDLHDDPHEVNNLAGDPGHAKVLADLRRRLRQWQEETKDPWLVKYKYE